jgi:hypothetical protein
MKNKDFYQLYRKEMDKGYIIYRFEEDRDLEERRKEAFKKKKYISYNEYRKYWDESDEKYANSLFYENEKNTKNLLCYWNT